MIHHLRCIIDILVDDEEYTPRGPIEKLGDGSLDSRSVISMRCQGAFQYVEGLTVKEVRTERWKPKPSTP